jgi:DNA-binding GntR family transcriptional regulator
MSTVTTQRPQRLRDRTTLSDLVAAELRERIIAGSLPMGAELNQFALTRELGVSRAVVREAFRQLEAAGLIRLTPYHHAIVIPLTPDDLEDLWEVRAVLECVAARRALRRMSAEVLARLEDLVEAMEREDDGEAWLELDRRFHVTVCDAPENPLLHKLLDTVRAAIVRSVRSTAGVGPLMRSANAEHRIILDALHRRDPASTQEALRRHFQRTRELLR